MPVFNRMQFKAARNFEQGELLAYGQSDGTHRVCIVITKEVGGCLLAVLKSSGQSPTPYLLWREGGFHALSYGKDWLFEAVDIVAKEDVVAATEGLKGFGAFLMADQVMMRLAGDPNNGGSGSEIIDMENGSIAEQIPFAERAPIARWRIWARPEDRSDPRSDPIVTSD